MRNPLLLFIFFLLLFTGNAYGQSLDFIGLKGISFGMKAADMTDKTIILDSTSAYKDTATYIRNTRCLNFFRSTENLQLSNFTASGIEYEFCDGELAYVFIHVKGQADIEHALTELQKKFHKLGCKGKPLNQCTQLDSSAQGMRVIVNIDHKQQTMDFVLIPKKAAK